MEVENKEICTKCGGRCCKKSGCDYAATDFENLSYNYLLDILNEGNISIVSVLNFQKLPDGRDYINPFLYLRARNSNRPVVDLLSLKTPCSQLTSTGCKYDLNDRPSGGVNLIPNKLCNCYQLKDQIELINTWKNYQKVLSRLVKRISGMSVDDRLNNDIENLFTTILNENFDNVSKAELNDIKGLIPILLRVCPNQYKKSLKQQPKIKIK